MFLVARHEFSERVRVAQPSEMFESVRCSNAANLRRDGSRQSKRQTLDQPASKRIANAGRIDDTARRDGGHMRYLAGPRENRRPVLPLRNDQGFRFLQE